MSSREKLSHTCIDQTRTGKIEVSEIFTFLNTYTQVCVFDYVGTPDLLSGINCRNKGI